MQRAMAFILLALASSGARGQSAGAPLEFDVASVKPSEPEDGMSHHGGCMREPVRYTCTNMALAGLVMQAYNIKRTQLSAPDFVDTERVDIAVKFPPGTTPAQFQEMMRNLLAQRFKLAAHYEEKETSIFELTVGKYGPKLKEAAASPAEEGGNLPSEEPSYVLAPDGYPVLGPGETGTRVMNGRARMSEPRYTMERLASWLSGQAGLMVKDATGLKGKYDIALTFTMGPVPDDFSGPSIFDAVQQQLGLKLERTKGKVATLTIDHLERVPTGN